MAFVCSSAKQEKKKSKNRTKTGTNVTDVARQIKVGGAEGVVNEQKVDLLLDMLKSADVTDTSNEESKTVKELESELREEGGGEGKYFRGKVYHHFVSKREIRVVA